MQQITKCTILLMLYLQRKVIIVIRFNFEIHFKLTAKVQSALMQGVNRNQGMGSVAVGGDVLKLQQPQY